MDLDLSSVIDAIARRVAPTAADPGSGWILLAVLAALAVVVVPILWRYARLAVTIVHELGHALVGVLAGRRFTGFVVNGDMSGHAVTVGRPRGPGRIASAWAGYPAPAVVGALLVQIAFGGWAGAALAAALLVLVVSLVFVRSAHTLAAVFGSAVVVGAVWWAGGPVGSAALALGAGLLLLLGAWRHLGAVATGGGRGDDPAQLASLTGVPSWLWVGSYVLVLGGCTWWTWTAVGPHLMPILRSVPGLA